MLMTIVMSYSDTDIWKIVLGSSAGMGNKFKEISSVCAHTKVSATLMVKILV